MKDNKILPLFLFFFCCQASTNAQTNANQIDSFTAKLATTIRNIDEEKVIVQTDRKVYEAGEKIWFSAFIFKATDHRLDTASKNLFVDLVNSHDKPVTQLVLNTVNLNTQGAITLTDTLDPGFYWLRSYTMKMLNEDAADIFIQPLYIFNKAKVRSDKNIPAAHTDAVIQFFPERNTGLHSFYSTGALQVLDGDGNTITASGNIINDDDSIAGSFTTNRFGFAGITFFNNPVHKYTAVVHAKDGDISYPLPAPNPTSAQLSVTAQDNTSIHAVVTLEGASYSRSRTTFVAGVSHGRVCFAASGQGMYKVSIPTEKFQGGAATLILADSALHVLCERRVFIDKNDYSINVQPDKPAFGARDSLHINIQLNDITGKPVLAALNISVQDSRLEQASEIMETDSLAPVNLPLEDWIIRNRNNLSLKDIDLFMLAQPAQYAGWLNGHAPIKNHYRDNTDSLLFFSGKVADRKNIPVDERVVTELSENANETTVFGADTTHNGGGFKLPIPQNSDSLLLKLQITAENGAPRPNDHIVLDTFLFPQFTTPVSLKNTFALSPVPIQTLLNESHTDNFFQGIGRNWLKPVTVKTIEKKAEPFDFYKRISMTSHIILGDQIGKSGFNDISTAVLMVPGVSIRYGSLNVQGSLLGEPIVILDGSEVMILKPGETPPGGSGGGHGSASSLGTQGQQVGSPSGAQAMGSRDATEDPSKVLQFLNSLNREDIDFIELLTNPADEAYYGARGATGVIVINTKSGSGKYVEDNGDMVMVRPQTYHTCPRFLMPDYSVPAAKNSKLPDPRTTIFWNGKLLTNGNGKASVKLYTADDNIPYVVTVTGITQNGSYVYKRITINGK